MAEIAQRLIKLFASHRFLLKSALLWMLVCAPINLVALWCGLVAPPYDHSSGGGQVCFIIKD